MKTSVVFVGGTANLWSINMIVSVKENDKILNYNGQNEVANFFLFKFIGAYAADF